MGGPTWTKSQEDMLRALWAEEHSCAAIANMLSVKFGAIFSRNSVIGKVHRLDLPMRERKKKAAPVSRPRSLSGRALKQQYTIRPRIETPHIVDAEIPAAQRKTVFGLTNVTCRWPVGDPTQSDFFFCGSPTADLADGRPYCASHSRIASRSEANPKTWGVAA